MTDSSRQRLVETVAEYRNLALTAIVGSLLLAIGVLLDLLSHGTPNPAVFWTSRFTGELGIAFIVGAIVATVIERRARARAEEAHDRRRREIESDVFRYLFGFGLHQNVAQELIETILVSKFLRENFSIEWQFGARVTIPNSQESGLDVLTTVSYSLRSTGRDPERYTISHYFENVLDLPQQSSRFVQLAWEAGGQRVQMSERDLAPLTRDVGIRRGIALDPITIAPDDPVRVTLSYRTIRRRNDSEVWITTLPTLGMTLTCALVDPVATTLEFQPDTSHRSQPISDARLGTVDSRLRTWQINSGILPYQGVVMYWHPVETSD